MSLELRLNNGYLECDFGAIDNPNPEHGEVCQLMIITRDYANEIAKGRYVYANLGGRSYVWELFDAHWWDNKGVAVYIGRWPD